MEIIKHSNDIWEYQNVTEDVENLLDSLINGQWTDYTNVGGGNTIIGASTGLNTQSPFYNTILKFFIDCYSDYILNKNISISLDGLDTMPIPERDWLEQKHFCIRRYDAGSVMFPHEDYGVPLRPKYTSLLYFNDNYEGGELAFPKENISIKPKAGSIIVFPSFFVHEVKLLKNGTRYLTSCYLYEKDNNA